MKNSNNSSTKKPIGANTIHSSLFKRREKKEAERNIVKTNITNFLNSKKEVNKENNVNNNVQNNIIENDVINDAINTVANQTNITNKHIQDVASEKAIITKKTVSNVEPNKKKEKKAKPLPPPTYVVTHYKSTIGFFSKVYKRNDMKWKIGVMCIVGLLMSFTSIVFIQNTGVYISGTSGIFQGFARVARVLMLKENVTESVVDLAYQLMFYGLYLITNIPLMIFSWYKMGKKFTILSSIPVLISNILPLLINLIPGTKDLFIFGNTTNPDATLQKYQVNLLNFDKNGEYAIYMFLYSIFAGLINGVAYSMALAVGGSTGGLDFITFFLAYKKKKPIATTMLIFNASSIFISSFIGSFIAAGIVDSQYWTFYNVISQNFLSGIIYVITINVVISNLFPKDKVVKIQIYCDDVIGIRNYLYSINFNHSLTINTTTGGYSLQEKKNIEIICLYIEIPKILAQVKNIDKYMLITITPIKGIDGRLSVEDALN